MPNAPGKYENCVQDPKTENKKLPKWADFLLLTCFAMTFTTLVPFEILLSRKCTIKLYVIVIRAHLQKTKNFVDPLF